MNNTMKDYLYFIKINNILYYIYIITMTTIKINNS